jgi:hypothetical protein
MMWKYVRYHYEYHSNNSIYGVHLKLVVADIENQCKTDVCTTLFTRAHCTVPDEYSSQASTLYFIKMNRNITLQIMPHKQTKSLTNYKSNLLKKTDYLHITEFFLTIWQILIYLRIFTKSMEPGHSLPHPTSPQPTLSQINPVHANMLLLEDLF